MGLGAEHPWAKAWREAVTPEQRDALWLEIQARRADNARRTVEKLRADLAKAERTCAACGTRLWSARRVRCPECVRLGRRTGDLPGGRS